MNYKLKNKLEELSEELSTQLHDEAWETIHHDKVDEVDEYVQHRKTEILTDIFFTKTEKGYLE